MGHGASKQEPRMEQRPVMKLIQLKIEEVKRRVRMRKSSIVSRAELLRMVDDDSAPSTAAKDKKEKQGAGSPEAIADAASGKNVKEEKRIDEEENVATEAAEEAEKKGDLGCRGAEEDDDDEKGRKLGCLMAYADLPESPSFRFYCTDLARDSDDDNSVKPGGGGRNGDQLPDMKKETRIAHESEDGTGSEDLEVKALKKEKRRKLKALTQAPSRVYDLLNVRNCYSHHSSTIIL